MSVSDPPSIAPGMATVWMDPSGNLLRLQVVPPEGDQPAAADATPPRTDWNRLLAAADIKKPSSTRSDPIWNPPFHSDARQAWTGMRSIRVEAASYRGRPVFFRLLGPWEKPAESAADPQTKGERVGQVLASILFVSVLLGGLLLARRT